MARDQTPLTIKPILAWADAHHERTGRWPALRAGRVREAPDMNWAVIDDSLRHGRRGLPGGSSLAQLLAKHGRKRNRGALPRLTIKQILAWADAHHRRTGQWPKRFSGKVHGIRGETWLQIDQAMRIGFRGFCGGNSLPRLLSARRGVRNLVEPRPLTVRQILAWADTHHRRTGEWPKRSSGMIYGPTGRPTGENWAAINEALGKGKRGLDRSTLGRLLAECRGVRHRMALPRLKLKVVLAWADAHRRRTGEWPAMTTGGIPEVPGETWSMIDSALRRGARWRGSHLSNKKTRELQRRTSE